MSRRELISIEPINYYVTVHPALDFWMNSEALEAIVSVGFKWKYIYETKRHKDGEEIIDTDIDMKTQPMCIMSNGGTFNYSKKELAARHIFHTGSVELSSCRWDYGDIIAFQKNQFAIDMPSLHNMIREQFEDYMDFYDQRLYNLFPCFVIYTYFYPLFSGAPIMQLWGEFKTGKTKICSLFEAMCFNPINSSNISGSSVFRLIESRRSTVIFDESEDIMTTDRARDIRNMLLAGTGKSGEAFRQEKMLDDRYKTQSFRVFSPKIIANIAGIQLASMQSRIIRITTMGTSNIVKSNKNVDQEDKNWEQIRCHLYRACLMYGQNVIDARENLPEHGLSGRSLFIWQGMLSIAHLCGEETWKDMVGYAHENKEYIEAETEEDADKPKQIARCLIELVDSDQLHDCYYSVEELMGYLNRQVTLNSKKELGLLLGRLGMHSRGLTKNGTYRRFYELEKDRLLAIIERR